MNEIEKFLAALRSGPLVMGQPMPPYFNAPLNPWSPPVWLIRLLEDMAERLDALEEKP